MKFSSLGCPRGWFGVGIVLLMASCGGGGGESASVGNGNSPGEPGGAVADARLQRFSTSAELEVYLKDGIRLRASRDDRVSDGFPNPESDGASAAPAPVDSRFSETNLQEAGVDEADTIKTDGRFLYTLVSPEYPFPGIRPVESDDPFPRFGEAPFIRILRISENPPDSREVARLDLREFENRVEGLYLFVDRDGGAPDLLVAVGGSAADIWGDWHCPYCWGNGTTEVGIFDVGDPERPRSVSRVSVDGRLLSSRRIGNRLYLVTRFGPELPGYVPHPRDPAERERNERILDAATLADLLPRISANGADQGALVAPERCFLPPREDDVTPEPGLITVTALNLDRPGEMESQSVAGPAETLYVSTESLYVATSRSSAIPPARWPARWIDEPMDGDALPPDFSGVTDIHKFRLEEAGPTYAGSGSVPGNLGWEVHKRPFRMSEFEGTLRVATSLGNEWDETSRTRLNLLREGEGGMLEETGFVDHIGKAGERLYASRFAGPRAFLVTFRMTDPLYVFDLSDPRNPVRAGELEIEGYSDYLHPIDENLLLGIGKDAVPDSSGDPGMRGAWYQGVKLSLFDISDSSRPFELDSMAIGKRGTESEVLHDHRGMAYLPPRNGFPARLALPIRLHDTPADHEWFDPSEPSAYYDWTRTGLYWFEIGAGGIVPAGRIVVADREEGDSERWGWGSGGDRSVLLGDSVHYVHDGAVWSAFWGNGTGASGPR
jgi:hypothetical protein